MEVTECTRQDSQMVQSRYGLQFRKDYESEADMLPFESTKFVFTE